MTVKEIKFEDLKNIGKDEWWGVIYTCPNCNKNVIWNDFNYCPLCGLKIIHKTK
jgi:rubrerythrin